MKSLFCGHHPIRIPSFLEINPKAARGPLTKSTSLAARILLKLGSFNGRDRANNIAIYQLILERSGMAKICCVISV